MNHRTGGRIRATAALALLAFVAPARAAARCEAASAIERLRDPVSQSLRTDPCAGRSIPAGATPFTIELEHSRKTFRSASLCQAIRTGVPALFEDYALFLESHCELVNALPEEGCSPEAAAVEFAVCKRRSAAVALSVRTGLAQLQSYRSFVRSLALFNPAGAPPQTMEVLSKAGRALDVAALELGATLPPERAMRGEANRPDPNSPGNKTADERPSAISIPGQPSAGSPAGSGGPASRSPASLAGSPPASQAFSGGRSASAAAAAPEAGTRVAADDPHPADPPGTTSTSPSAKLDGRFEGAGGRPSSPLTVAPPSPPGPARTTAASAAHPGGNSHPLFASSATAPDEQKSAGAAPHAKPSNEAGAPGSWGGEHGSTEDQVSRALDQAFPSNPSEIPSLLSAGDSAAALQKILDGGEPPAATPDIGSSLSPEAQRAGSGALGQETDVQLFDRIHAAMFRVMAQGRLQNETAPMVVQR